MGGTMHPTHWLIAVLVIAFGLTLAVAKHSRSELAVAQGKLTATEKALQTAQDARKRDARASAAREKARAATAQSAASAAHSLDKALAAQPEWAEQPVPKEVRDALAD